MTKLILTYIGRDNWDRPVYERNGRLYVDIDPGCVYPAIHTKSSNDFYGEPDMPISGDVEIDFIPRRDTWY